MSLVLGLISANLSAQAWFEPRAWPRIQGDKLEVLCFLVDGRWHWGELMELSSVGTGVLLSQAMAGGGLYALDDSGWVWERARYGGGYWRAGRVWRGGGFVAGAKEARLWGGGDSLWAYYPKGQSIYGLYPNQRQAQINLDSSIEKLSGHVVYQAEQGPFWGLDNYLRLVQIRPQTGQTQVVKLIRNLAKNQQSFQFWLNQRDQAYFLSLPSQRWFSLNFSNYQIQALHSSPLASNQGAEEEEQASWPLDLGLGAGPLLPPPFLVWEIQPQSDGFSFMLQGLIDRQGRWDEIELEVREQGQRDWQSLERRSCQGSYDFFEPFGFWYRQTNIKNMEFRLRLRDSRQIEILSPIRSLVNHRPFSRDLALFPEQNFLWLYYAAADTEDELILYNALGQVAGRQVVQRPALEHWYLIYLREDLPSGHYWISSRATGLQQHFFLPPAVPKGIARP